MARSARRANAPLSSGPQSSFEEKRTLDVVHDEPPAKKAAPGKALAPITSFAIAPENPRTIRRDEDVDQLAATLRSEGQLQPVIGYKEHGKLQITAGGTRFLAAQKAKLASLWFEERPKEAAIRAGLVEQDSHTPLHAADQARAYAAELTRLNGDGPITRDAAIATIANRAGRTPRFVSQRLALAGLHPPILKALSDNKIDLPIAAAWANAPLDRQAKAWTNNHQLRDVRAIKTALARGRLAASDNLVKFVGLKAYQTAGGELDQDLFSFASDYGREADTLDDAGKQGVFIADSGLVNRLAREKLQRAATAREKEGWGFVEFGLSDYPAAKYERANEPKDKASRAKLGLWITVEKYDHKLQTTVIRKKPEEKAPAKAAKGSPASMQQQRGISYEIEREFDNVADVLAGRAISGHPTLAVAVIAADMARNMLKCIKGSGSMVGEFYLPGERMKVGLMSDSEWASRVAVWEKELAPHEGKLVEYLSTLPTSSLHDLLALGVGFFFSGNEGDSYAKAAVKLTGIQEGEDWSPTEKQLLGLSTNEIERCARELGIEPSAKPADTVKAVAMAAKGSTWYPRFVRERLGMPDPGQQLDAAPAAKAKKAGRK